MVLEKRVDKKLIMNKINILSDLLVSIKNGYSNNNKYAYCKLNQFCLTVLWVLYKEGLINDYKIEPNNSKIKIKLKYYNNKPLMNNITLISKPSFKHFINYEDLKSFDKKFDYYFLSTSSGIVSSRNIEKDLKIGGQLLFGLKLN